MKCASFAKLKNFFRAGPRPDRFYIFTKNDRRQFFYLTLSRGLWKAGERARAFRTHSMRTHLLVIDPLHYFTCQMEVWSCDLEKSVLPLSTFFWGGRGVFDEYCFCSKFSWAYKFRKQQILNLYLKNMALKINVFQNRSILNNCLNLFQFPEFRYTQLIFVLYTIFNRPSFRTVNWNISLKTHASLTESLLARISNISYLIPEAGQYPLESVKGKVR